MAVAILQQVANHNDMMLGKRVKSGVAAPLLVGVISTPSELVRAASLRQMPHLFELRLDALASIVESLASDLVHLRAPLLITARDAAEGGPADLASTQRRDLLLRYLPHAALVDVELRNVRQLRRVLETAAVRGVRRVISVHQLADTPAIDRMHELLENGIAAGADIFKIVTRTDTADELDRLLAFFESAKDRAPISAMGIGKLGAESRRLLARRGSALNYAHLGAAHLQGQLSLAEMRRVLHSAPSAVGSRTPHRRAGS